MIGSWNWLNKRSMSGRILLSDGGSSSRNRSDHARIKSNLDKMEMTSITNSFNNHPSGVRSNSWQNNPLNKTNSKSNRKTFKTSLSNVNRSRYSSQSVDKFNSLIMRMINPRYKWPNRTRMSSFNRLWMYFSRGKGSLVKSQGFWRVKVKRSK